MCLCHRRPGLPAGTVPDDALRQYGGRQAGRWDGGLHDAGGPFRIADRSDDIAKIAGAGTLVPITGFANAIAAPAVEFQTEGFVLGVGAKMFTIAGPVIVYGLSASVVYGVIYFFATL